MTSKKPAEAKPITVFVYGSLKKGGHFHFALSRSKFLRNARTVGRYTLYNLGDFPGMVCGGNTEVPGELYEINHKTQEHLDYIEGVDDKLFKRAFVTLEGGGRAIAYFVCEPDLFRNKQPIKEWIIK